MVDNQFGPATIEQIAERSFALRRIENIGFGHSPVGAKPVAPAREFLSAASNFTRSAIHSSRETILCGFTLLSV